MKKITYLLSLSIMVMLAHSCKKDKKEEPIPPTPATVTYSNLTLGIGLVDWQTASWPGTFSLNRKAIIQCGGVAIDSLLALDTTCTSIASFDPCAMYSTLNINYKSFKIQDGADNYLEIYDNGLLIAQSKIMFSPYTYLNAVTANSSPGTGNYTMPGGACLTLCIPYR